jgi:Na+/melibiose symporter-like transporter
MLLPLLPFLVVQFSYDGLVAFHAIALRYYLLNHINLSFTSLNLMSVCTVLTCLVALPWLASVCDRHLHDDADADADAHRHSYVMMTCVGVTYAASCVALFSVRRVDGASRIAWLTCFFVVNQASCLLFQLNWHAYGARVARAYATHDRVGRTMFLAVVSPLTSIATVVSAALFGSLPRDSFDTINHAYAGVFVASLVGVAAVLRWRRRTTAAATGVAERAELAERAALVEVAIAQTHAPAPAVKRPARATLSALVAHLIRVPTVRLFALHYALASASIIMPRDSLLLQLGFRARQDEIGLASVVAHAVGACTTFVLVARTTQRYDKVRVYAACIYAWCVGVGVSVWCVRTVYPDDAPLTSQSAFWLMVVSDAMFGMPQAAFVQLLLADLVDYDRLVWAGRPKHNLLAVGVQFGGVGAQLAASVQYALLYAAGLHDLDHLAEDAARDPAFETRVAWLLRAMTCAGVVLPLVSIACLLAYPLTTSVHARVLSMLRARTSAPHLRTLVDPVRGVPLASRVHGEPRDNALVRARGAAQNAADHGHAGGALARWLGGACVFGACIVLLALYAVEAPFAIGFLLYATAASLVYAWFHWQRWRHMGGAGAGTADIDPADDADAADDDDAAAAAAAATTDSSVWRFVRLGGARAWHLRTHWIAWSVPVACVACILAGVLLPIAFETTLLRMREIV